MQTVGDAQCGVTQAQQGLDAAGLSGARASVSGTSRARKARAEHTRRLTDCSDSSACVSAVVKVSRTFRRRCL